MNILLEGPRWAGMWSEIVQDSLRNIGHKVFLHYHNRKPLSYLLWSGAVPTLFRHGSRESKARFASWSNNRVLELLKKSDFDMILSIQGKIDGTCLRAIRRDKPDVKILYWIGDVLSPGGEEKIREIAGEVDGILLSYRGDYERMKIIHPGKIIYFPFGVSKKYHAVKAISVRERKLYASDVSFVGTYYPERGDALKYLMENGSPKIGIWGRSWRRSGGLASRGRLPLENAQKVHALSKISLNIHHVATKNGFNMKFLEIPASGGFELCDWQDEIEDQGLSGLVATYKTREEMKEKLDYFLKNPGPRDSMARKFRDHVTTRFCYDRKFFDLLERL